MGNENLLNQLIGKVKELEVLRTIAYFDGTKEDWETYNDESPALERKIGELKAKVLSKMEVK